MSDPRVSVLLPVYNGGPYLRQALDSLLGQSFADFEVIAIDDGSADDSLRILESVADSRFKVYHQENRGLATTLNRAIGLASGRYLARQDQDDLSRPARFEKQAAFLDAHPDTGLVGTWAEVWQEHGPSGRFHRHPTENAALQFELLFDNPFVHSSVMLRRSAVEAVGAYSTDPSRQPPEDYELWCRLARHCRVANLPEPLLVYREVATSMSRAGRAPFLEGLLRLSAEQLAWHAGRDPADEAARDCAALLQGAYDRASAAPSLRRMLALLRGAAQGVARHAGVSVAVFGAAARARRIRLLYHWGRCRLGMPPLHLPPASGKATP